MCYAIGAPPLKLPLTQTRFRANANSQNGQRDLVFSIGRLRPILREPSGAQTQEAGRNGGTCGR